MGLQQRVYSLENAPDWACVQSSLESSMGVRVRIVPAGTNIMLVRSLRVGGAAYLFFSEDGRLEWEASFNENPYFLMHVHRALVAAGARPLGSPWSDDGKLARRWREMPLGYRLASGLVGQVARYVLMLLVSPLVLVGLVLANVFVMARKALRAHS